MPPHNRTCPTYYLDSMPLQSVFAYKYLGVNITPDISWRHQIEHIFSSANRMLGFLKIKLSFHFFITQTTSLPNTSTIQT